MNNCILMAEIIKEPELRFTPDGLELTEMLVQFSATREGEPPATLRVIGWGNLAKDIQQSYHTGDRVLLEGRLGMHTIDRPEGFKEKRAELTVQKIYPLLTGEHISSSPAIAQTTSTPVATASKATATYESPVSAPIPTASNAGTFSQKNYTESKPPSPNYDERSSYPTTTPAQEPDPDDIPF